MVFRVIADLFVTVKSTNKLSSTIAGERLLYSLRTQFVLVSFLFLCFYLYPCYPWISHPFNSSPHLWASFVSHQLLLIHFFHVATQSAPVT
jgi:hypothetical protein